MGRECKGESRNAKLLGTCQASFALHKKFCLNCTIRRYSTAKVNERVIGNGEENAGTPMQSKCTGLKPGASNLINLAVLSRHKIPRVYRGCYGVRGKMTPGDVYRRFVPNSVPTAQPAGSSASAMSTNRAIQANFFCKCKGLLFVFTLASWRSPRELLVPFLRFGCGLKAQEAWRETSVVALASASLLYKRRRRRL